MVPEADTHEELWGGPLRIVATWSTDPGDEPRHWRTVTAGGYCVDVEGLGARWKVTHGPPPPDENGWHRAVLEAAPQPVRAAVALGLGELEATWWAERLRRRGAPENLLTTEETADAEVIRAEHTDETSGAWRLEADDGSVVTVLGAGEMWWTGEPGPALEGARWTPVPLEELPPTVRGALTAARRWNTLTRWDRKLGAKEITP